MPVATSAPAAAAAGPTASSSHKPVFQTKSRETVGAVADSGHHGELAYVPACRLHPREVTSFRRGASNQKLLRHSLTQDDASLGAAKHTRHSTTIAEESPAPAVGKAKALKDKFSAAAAEQSLPVARGSRSATVSSAHPRNKAVCLCHSASLASRLPTAGGQQDGVAWQGAGGRGERRLVASQG